MFQLFKAPWPWIFLIFMISVCPKVTLMQPSVRLCALCRFKILMALIRSVNLKVSPLILSSCSCAKEQKKCMKIAKVALTRLSEFIAASKFAALWNNNILIKPKHPNLGNCTRNLELAAHYLLCIEDAFHTILCFQTRVSFWGRTQTAPFESFKCSWKWQLPN